MLTSSKVFHLVGEQVLPIFLSAIQFEKSAKHYLLYTGRTEKQAADIQTTLQNDGFSAELLLLAQENSAGDFTALAAEIPDMVNRVNSDCSEFHFNLTGGTKPMALVAILQREQYKGTPNFFYLDFRQLKIWTIGKNIEAMPLEKYMSMRHFFSLQGNAIQEEKTEYTESRKMLAEFAFKCASLLQRYQKQMSDFEKTPNLKNKFEFACQDLLDDIVKSGICGKKKAGEWNKSLDKHCKNWLEKAKFLAGGWFEEYVFCKLKEKHPELEIALNLKVSHVPQEFDVVCSDGHSMVILECKAGKVSQDHVHKLFSVGNTYSGALGKRALITLNPENNRKNADALERIKESRLSISAFCGEKGLELLLDNPMGFAVNRVFPEKQSAGFSPFQELK